MSVIVDDLTFEIIRQFKEIGVLKLEEVLNQFSTRPKLYNYQLDLSQLAGITYDLRRRNILNLLTPQSTVLQRDLTYQLTPIGEEIFKFNVKESENLAEIESLNRRKLKVDIENAEQTLKSYPFTKRAAWIALVISIILAIIEIVKLIHGFLP